MGTKGPKPGSTSINYRGVMAPRGARRSMQNDRNREPHGCERENQRLCRVNPIPEQFRSPISATFCLSSLFACSPSYSNSAATSSRVLHPREERQSFHLVSVEAWHRRSSQGWNAAPKSTGVHGTLRSRLGCMERSPAIYASCRKLTLFLVLGL